MVNQLSRTAMIPSKEDLSHESWPFWGKLKTLVILFLVNNCPFIQFLTGVDQLIGRLMRMIMVIQNQ